MTLANMRRSRLAASAAAIGQGRLWDALEEAEGIEYVGLCGGVLLAMTCSAFVTHLRRRLRRKELE